MDTANILLAIIGTGGIASLVATIWRLRSDNRKTGQETTHIFVQSAETVVGVQLGEIKRLDAENAELRSRIEALERQLADVAALRDRISELERHLAQAERDRDSFKLEAETLRGEAETLRGRVDELEGEVAALKAQGEV